MLSLRCKVIWFALTTRGFIIALQFAANLLVPDHDAHVFLAPVNPNVTYTTADRAIQLVLGGFNRWDAQYFLHISEHGYTYENTMAFFTLFPMLVRVGAAVLMFSTRGLVTSASAYLLSAVLLNVFFFVRSALSLYDLTYRVLHGARMAYISSVLYCVSPASIFLTAPYSESLYAWCSFQGMIKCLDCSSIRFANISVTSSLPIGLSLATRSNGMLNLGFVLYCWTQSVVQKTWPEISNRFRTLKVAYLMPCLLLPLVIATSQLMLTLALSLLPFLLSQMYCYYKYCVKSDQYLMLPPFIIQYGDENGFVMPGMSPSPPWCDYRLPYSYQYIQDHYWDVGFLRYYTIKQIPNFLLAAPILCFVGSHCVQFLKLHWRYALRLGIFNVHQQTHVKAGLDKQRRFPHRSPALAPEILPFVLHALFLVAFCTLCVQVQVTTRLIGSASPVLYWFAASYVEPQVIRITYNREKRHRQIDSPVNMNSIWRTFIITETFHGPARLIKMYFLGYLIVGTIMFCNFLPWT